jgi:hypothetical protein
MSYDQLSRDYEPRDPYSSAEQRQKGIDMGQYAHNMAQQQDRFNPKSILGASVEKQRQHGNVTREVQQLEKNLHALASVIDSLDIRLAAACIPAPETAPGLRGSDGGGCSLANQLAAFNSMLACQVNRIEMLYQGVDL